MILNHSWDIMRHVLQYFKFPNTRWLNVGQLLTHVEHIRICFSKLMQRIVSFCVKTKNRWDWRNAFDCHIFNMLCRYSTWEFELYTTDYNTNKRSYQKANIGVWCNVLVTSFVKSVENRTFKSRERDRKTNLLVCKRVRYTHPFTN